MSGLKGGALLLVMGIPLALYCALQVKGVAGDVAGASEVPPDRGPTKEQLASGQAKSAAWRGEVGKAATVAYQYRAPSREEASRDADAASVMKAASARAADLNDLDLFLSETEAPKFNGALKPRYEAWMGARGELKRDADAVEAWLRKPPAIHSAADADKALAKVGELIGQYSGRSRFSDTAKAAEWRVRARLAVIDALARAAGEQYRDAVREKLPLEPGANKVETAAKTLEGLKAQITALGADVKQAGQEKARLEALRAEIKAKGAVADECAARQELLALFARDDLFTNPGGVAPWLKEVAAQYGKSKDSATKSLIREKVQEFCEALIPPAARLDDEVILAGKAVQRQHVVIKYQEKVGGAVMRKPLSGELDGANEFNLTARHPGNTTFLSHMGNEYEPQELKPTELSKVAVLYNAARSELAERAAPRWTPGAVKALKNKCEAGQKLVDQLQKPGTGSAGKPLQLWKKLGGLASGAEAHPELFGAR